VAVDDEARPFEGMSQDDRRPVPDPTVLTTQALYREVSALQELIEQSIRGTREVIDQQFYKVEQQFELVERQRVEQKGDTKGAVDAALDAAKEANAKSEEAFTKQIERLSQVIETTAADLRRSIDELKERLVEVDKKADAISQQKIGGQEVTTERRDNLSGVYALVGAFGLIITIAISVIALIATKP
jgi:archaellum component FlaC